MFVPISIQRPGALAAEMVPQDLVSDTRATELD